MTAANTETVKALYAAFKRRDIVTVLDGLAPDVTWGQLGREQDLPMSGIRRGPAGAAEFFRVMAGLVEITAFEPQRFLAAEDKVFAWGTWSWVMRHNGVAGENEWLHVFTFRDGKVAEWRGYNDTAQLALAWRAPTAAGQRTAAE